MSIRRGNVILAGAGAGGGANPDEVTINLNSSDKLQALGTINKNLSSDTSAIYNWIGTLEEYNTQNVETLHPEWVCYITDDSDPGSSGGLEIGDIGIAPLGIDETQNKRRYLNGQVISQSQFESFTDKLKSIVALYQNIATTEVNWQAEVTNSALGQCGKFVIDDVAGTIRLPKVVNINGLQDLTGLGGIKAESLPNIKGGVTDDGASWQNLGKIDAFYGCIEPTDNTGGYAQTGGKSSTLSGGWSIDASLSSSTYQDDAPVQQEAVQYPYFIQVATGVETSIDVSREIELNNPFSLLDYKYSEYELSNASWLLSNGQYNSGATYPAVYNLLLQIYNGTVTKAGVSVKLSTDTYADTDFVLNTSDTTFRLPVKVLMAGSKRVAGNGMTLGWTDGTYTGGTYSNTSGYGLYANGTLGKAVGQAESGTTSLQVGKALGITTDETKSGIETSANGLYLYFYVGETVQDANIIAAGQALTDIANLKAHYITETYVNGTSWYRVYSDGWCEQGGYANAVSTDYQTCEIVFLKEFIDTNYVFLHENNTTNWSSTVNGVPAYTAKTTASIKIFAYSPYTNGSNWRACGYIS